MIMKVLTIVGARPQFIKAGSVSRAMKKHHVHEVIVHTGQHYDANMSDIFFEEMKIPKPDYFLGVGGKSHAAMTGQMMEKIEEVAINEKPDCNLVYGDTNTTLAGALVASKLHIKLAHVEAGLRSFNMKMPEEVNRILTDRVSDVLFCPTQIAVDNLMNEGYSRMPNKIVLSGDVMQDGAIFYKDLARKPADVVVKDDFILCTIHRAENTDNHDRLRSIFEGLNEIGKNHQIILPLHPRTRNILNELDIDLVNITLINPVGYLEMVWLISNSSLIMTDSGGLQKEAYFFEKPCVTLRDETEWLELVENKFNILVGASKDALIGAFENRKHLFSNDYATKLYGNGNASDKIVKELSVL